MKIRCTIKKHMIETSFDFTVNKIYDYNGTTLIDDNGVMCTPIMEMPPLAWLRPFYVFEEV